MNDARAGAVPAHEDPMSADRRTLVIGAVAMVVLVGVGVVSAQLFARGGCASLPSPVEVAAQPDLPPVAVLDDALPVPDDAAAIVAALEELLGAAVTAAVPVGPATELLPTRDGVVAAGPRTTAFDPRGVPVAALELGARDRLVGDGDTLFVATVPNELTGQLDAVVPVAGDDLRLGTCLDTAVVGAPFAFLLDAADGDLLLFRVEDDAEDTELELRDGGDGHGWGAPLTLGSGSPGVLAERLDARLGDDTVVVARRTAPDDGAPALLEFVRDDGSPRGEIDAATLADAAGLDADQPLVFEVVGVGRDVAFVTVTPDDEEPASEPILLTVELDLGTTLGAVPLPGPMLAADVAGDRLALVTVLGDGELEVATVDARATQLTVRGQAGPSERASVSWRDGDVVVGSAGSLLVATGDGATVAALGVDVLDVAPLDDRIAVLLGHEDGDGAVVVFLAARRDG